MRVALPRGELLRPRSRPKRGDLTEVGGTPDGSRLWAVGGKGTIVRLTGGRIREEDSGTDVDLYDVWIIGPWGERHL